jgi:hypothetical protein
LLIGAPGDLIAIPPETIAAIHGDSISPLVSIARYKRRFLVGKE